MTVHYEFRNSSFRLHHDTDGGRSMRASQSRAVGDGHHLAKIKDQRFVEGVELTLGTTYDKLGIME